MKAVNLVAITATLNLLLQLCMTALGNYVIAITRCDFSEDTSRFEPGTTLLFEHNFREGDTIEISCPRNVDGVDYSIYPGNPTKYAYVYNHLYSESESLAFRLKEWPLEQIFGKISTEPIVQWKDEKSRDVLVIKYPRDKLLVRRLDSHLVYVCKPNGIDYESPEMRMALRLTLSHACPQGDDVIGDITSSGKGAAFVEPTAIFKLVLTDLPVVTHGCGNPHGQLFLNQKKRDTDEAFQDCTVDIMQTPNVGFYCDGNIYPPDCFDTFVGYDDPDIPHLGFHSPIPKRHNLYYMNYDRTRYPKPFSGMCYCSGGDTIGFKATITVTRGVTQTCDLGSLFFENRLQPFVGDWCDVVLHLVDTLTIMYPPITGIYDHTRGEYEDYEGFEGRWISTLIPTKANEYLMRRVFKPDGDGMQFEMPQTTWETRGLIIKHDRLNRRITVKNMKLLKNAPAFLFHYIWRYTSRFSVEGEINASVQVAVVLDPHHDRS